MMDKLEGILNDLRFRSKFTLMYVLCVVIPILVTNFFVLQGVIINEDAKQAEALNHAANTAEQCIRQTLNAANNLTITLFTDESIASYLDTQYASPAEYYDAYHKLNAVYINEAANAEGLDRLLIYTQNRTILTGGLFARLSTVENSIWYRSYLSSGSSIFLCHYNDVQENRLFGGPYWRISLVRNLNYYGDKNNAKLVKADISYNKLRNKLENAAFGFPYYICSGNVVLFSNADPRIGYQYMLMDEAIADDASVMREIELYGQAWQLYIISNAPSYWDALLVQWPILLVLLCVNFALPLLVIRAVSRSIGKRSKLLTEHLTGEEDGSFRQIELPPSKDEIGVLVQQYNLMSSQMKRLIECNYQSKIDMQAADLARQSAELLALRSQINPHFVFNTMESIRMHSLIRNELETADILGQFAVLLRRMTQWYQDSATLSEEMDSVRAYIDIQQYRFGERLRFSSSIDPACSALMLPKMTLLTFVENACVHGVEKSAHGGRVTVEATRDGDDCTILVKDDGAGMIAEKAEQVQDWMNSAEVSLLRTSGQIGIMNACIRLRHVFGSRVRFRINSAPDEGTAIHIAIASAFNTEESSC